MLWVEHRVHEQAAKKLSFVADSRFTLDCGEAAAERARRARARRRASLGSEELALVPAVVVHDLVRAAPGPAARRREPRARAAATGEERRGDRGLPPLVRDRGRQLRAPAAEAARGHDRVRDRRRARVLLPPARRRSSLQRLCDLVARRAAVGGVGPPARARPRRAARDLAAGRRLLDAARPGRLDRRAVADPGQDARGHDGGDGRGSRASWPRAS